MYAITTRLARLATCAALTMTLLVAAVPAVASAQGTQSGTSVSANLPVGGWVAYSFSYPGDLSSVRIDMAYSPSDATIDQGVQLDAYAPGNLPPDGVAFAHGVKPDTTQAWFANAPTTGLQTLPISASQSGTFMVVAHNYTASSANVPVSINLATALMTNTTAGVVSTAGPVLTLVSSSDGVSTSVVTAPVVASATASAPSAPSAAPLPMPGGSSSVSATIQPNGWVAYSFNYAGDLSSIRIDLTYSPSDATIDQAVEIDAFAPGNLPPDGVAFAHGVKPDTTEAWFASAPATGIQTLPISSSQAGTYVVIVHNYDTATENVPVSITLTSALMTNTLAGVVSTAGPALTFVSASQ
jgi:hypothetical protein